MTTATAIPTPKPKAPGEPTLTPGQAAWVEYRNLMGGEDRNGYPLPTWKSMTNAERTAWERAAQESAHAFWGQL